MATRVNAREVKEIMDNCSLDNPIVTSFIIAANAVVTKVFASDTTITTQLLIEIEKFYTAHLIASTKERQTVSEKLENASVKYTGLYGRGLDATTYGQIVKQLDVTGKFAAYVGKKQASIYAVKNFNV